MKGEKEMKETRTEEILAEREKTHGSYSKVSVTAQRIKEILRAGPSYEGATFVQRESLDMIAAKLARIVNGNSFHEDSWADIAGYATLVVKAIQEGKLGAF
jgi:hypothetical protein